MSQNMVTLFNTPFNSPLLITLIIIYFIISSITTFDIRLIQAKKSGLLTLSEQLPKWVAIIHWIEIVILITIILLNWKVAIVVYLVRFVLKVLPVLETIGNIIMSPFKIKS